MQSAISIQIFLLCVFGISVNGLHLPSFIKSCNAREPGFKECAIRNGNEAFPHIVKGVRDYNIPSFTPLVLPFVRLGAAGLDLNATNVKITGLAAGKLIDAGIDVDKPSLFFRLTFPKIDLDFDYSVGGKIVSLPIEGHGKGEIEMSTAIIQYGFVFHVHEKNGIRLLQIGKEEFDIKPEGMRFDFKDLFNGDKTLGDNLNKFLTENWKDVLAEIGPGIGEVVGTVVKSIVSNLLNEIPLEEVLPGY